ncbi:Xaa-Pro aminopeptidase [Alteromonas sp. a30]|uniref:Xaa-Pro aminopeptidase n=1 Tax=Alteromonas sp. a30 TaxID=2730917 RepID=UPI0022815370|nr:Xaa-Pro aminopeptidase [Alteromonas sp. a30]MCY7295453.1 Xaa-Pro aminopeptidase [Alteromonas sp. a30]
MIAKTEFLQRRETLMSKLPVGSVVVVASAEMHQKGNGTEAAFTQDSDFLYLTGFNEPQAWLVLIHDDVRNGQAKNHRSVLFCQTKDKLAEIWNGRRLGVEQAPSELLVDEAHAIDDFEGLLPELLNEQKQVYFLLGSDDAKEAELMLALQLLRQAPKQTKTAPSMIVDLAPMLHEMRLFKSPAELAVMREAAEMSCRAHVRAMKRVQEGVFEYQLEADILHEFAMSGARSAAYNTIVGAGENACILHYTDNNCAVKKGDLVLIDAGAHYQGYAADITRTFPVSGKFSEAQASLYNLVLESQLKAMQVLVPGNTLKQATQVAVEVICQGLIERSILSGSLEYNLEHATWRQFFMHGLGHWLGMNVHDVGNYKVNGEDRPLQPGMVLTVEPGIYIDSQADVDPKWHGIGIRIEDDIVITADGHEVLTQNVPKTIDDIEALMAEK